MLFAGCDTDNTLWFNEICSNNNSNNDKIIYNDDDRRQWQSPRLNALKVRWSTRSTFTFDHLIISSFTLVRMHCDSSRELFHYNLSNRNSFSYRRAAESLMTHRIVSRHTHTHRHTRWSLNTFVCICTSMKFTSVVFRRVCYVAFVLICHRFGHICSASASANNEFINANKMRISHTDAHIKSVWQWNEWKRYVPRKTKN